MKRSKPQPRQSFSLSEIEAKLIASNIQPTAQRIALCRYLLCEADHPTAEDIKAWADKNFPKLSLATVYNTVKVLVEGALLREFRFPHSEKVIYDCNMEDHYHFVDESSGEIYDLKPDQLKVIPQLGKQFQVKGVEVILTGRKLS